MKKIYIRSLALLAITGFLGLIAVGQPMVTVHSDEQILKGALVATDRDNLEPFVIRFRSEQRLSDSNGFFSFSKKADNEIFEDLPIRSKIQRAMNDVSVREIDSALATPHKSSLITPVRNADKYYLLISKQVVPVTDGVNNVTGLRQPADEPHLFFSFVAQNTAQSEIPVIIKPRSLEKRNYLLPADRTIIISLNPCRVKKVEYWPFKLKPQFLQMPRVVLKTDKEIAQEKMAKSEGAVQESAIPQSGHIATQAAKSLSRALPTWGLYEQNDGITVYKLNAKKQPIAITAA